jgi:predicted tellurium resistance membrane protein TerC
MDYQIIISLITLIALEVVLGIDNVIFISIIANKLPPEQQKKARQWGLILAAAMRIVLLLIISIIMKLDKKLFTLIGNEITGKELILILGGLFLLYKSTKEIYSKTEGGNHTTNAATAATTFGKVLLQILILDLVFSVDSIITAIGMVNEVWVMYIAVIVTVLIMMVAAEPISNFVNKHPAFKMLALAFLLLIGFSLITEGFGIEIPKGYIYFSMAFSLLVDILQMKMNSKKTV